MTNTSRFFTRLTPLLTGMMMSIATLAAGQQPAVVVDDDDITIRGCVARVAPGSPAAESTLVWTRGDIMLSKATSLNAGQLTERVFYWLEDDEDLSAHVGQMVEVEGELGDFEKGEVEIERDGEFTDIELKLDGETEKARVPTAWLGTPRGEGEFDIVARKVEVEKVNVLGACEAR